MSYSGLDALRDVLIGAEFLGQGSRAIDIGRNYRMLQADPKNTGTARLKRVRLDPGFEGYGIFSLKFTDTSAYTSYVKPDGDTQVKRYVAEGSRWDDFEAPDPDEPTRIMFSLETGDWSGVPAAGDLFSWVTSVRISEERVLRIGDRVDVWIDNMLTASKRYKILDPTQRIFEYASPAPEDIIEAHVHMWAYALANRVHANARLENSPYKWLFDVAKSLVDHHIEGLPGGSIVVIGRKPVIPTSIGDEMVTPVFGDDVGRQDIMAVESLMRLHGYTEDTIGLDLVWSESDL